LKITVEAEIAEMSIAASKMKEKTEKLKSVAENQHSELKNVQNEIERETELNRKSEEDLRAVEQAHAIVMEKLGNQKLALKAANEKRDRELTEIQVLKEKLKNLKSKVAEKEEIERLLEEDLKKVEKIECDNAEQRATLLKLESDFIEIQKKIENDSAQIETLSETQKTHVSTIIFSKN